MKDNFLFEKTELENPDIDMHLSHIPLAMSYVPMQRWQEIYDPDVGLSRGTIFQELDLPFLGRRAIEK